MQKPSMHVQAKQLTADLTNIVPYLSCSQLIVFVQNAHLLESVIRTALQRKFSLYKGCSHAYLNITPLKCKPTKLVMQPCTSHRYGLGNSLSTSHLKHPRHRCLANANSLEHGPTYLQIPHKYLSPEATVL